MRSTTVWPALLGVEKTVVERVEFDEDEELLVAHVRPRRRSRSRCGICRRPCPGYDRGEGRRRWRALDLGLFRAFVEADAPRAVSYTHLRAHETPEHLVCRLLLEKKNKQPHHNNQ